MKNKFKYYINYPLLIASFICFIIILIWALIFKLNMKAPILEQLNLLNWNIFKRFSKPLESPLFLSERPINVILNFYIFIPLGIYLPLLFNKQNILRDSLIAISLILAIELFQLFSAIGTFELTDIFLNLIGFYFGSLIYSSLRAIVDSYSINIINLVIILIAIPISIYAITNTILNYELYIPFFNGEAFKSLWR